VGSAVVLVCFILAAVSVYALYKKGDVSIELSLKPPMLKLNARDAKKH